MCNGPLNDCHVVSAEGFVKTGFIPCDGSRGVVDTLLVDPGDVISCGSVYPARLATFCRATAKLEFLVALLRKYRLIWYSYWATVAVVRVTGLTIARGEGLDTG